jgi:hypothetical protein
MFLIAWAIIPAWIALHGAIILLEIVSFFGFGHTLGLIDIDKQYEYRQHTDWNGYINSNCLGGAMNVDRHWWGRYTYTCYTRVGTEGNVPLSGWSLVFSAWWASVLVFIPGVIWKYVQQSAQASNSTHNLRETQRNYFDKGFESAKDWAADNLGKTILIVAASLIVTILYHLGITSG